MIFDIQEYGSYTSAERMSTLASLLRQEIPYLRIIVKEPTRHIRVLWGIEKLPLSYANRTALVGHIIAFSCNIIAGETPPTITISNDWWEVPLLTAPYLSPVATYTLISAKSTAWNWDAHLRN